MYQQRVALESGTHEKVCYVMESMQKTYIKLDLILHCRSTFLTLVARISNFEQQIRYLFFKISHRAAHDEEENRMCKR